MSLNQVCVFRLPSHSLLHCLFTGTCTYHFAMKHFVEYSNKHHIERNYFSPVLADFWGI